MIGFTHLRDERKRAPLSKVAHYRYDHDPRYEVQVLHYRYDPEWELQFLEEGEAVPEGGQPQFAGLVSAPEEQLFAGDGATVGQVLEQARAEIERDRKALAKAARGSYSRRVWATARRPPRKPRKKKAKKNPDTRAILRRAMRGT